MTGYKLGYARVSTSQQDETLQLDALQSAGCERVFIDKEAEAINYFAVAGLAVAVPGVTV